MKVFRLEPDRAKLSDPRWESSIVRETIWVTAETEKEARNLAAQQSARATPVRRYKKIGTSPWYDFSLASCGPDLAKNDIPMHGIVVKADGVPVCDI
jgi:hypothetical protein